MVQELLTEKLRPKELKFLILPERIRRQFNDGLQQNVLLSGSPGCGKTSTAKILAKDHPTLFINVSDESSVDVVREKINNFCMMSSVMGGKAATKIVILDEFDGASDQFYKALRGTVEKFAVNTRFIATCNWINKVPEAIQSRFEVIDFDPITPEEEQYVRNEWKKRVSLILTKLKITIEDEALEEFTKMYFPDFRSALNKIQSLNIGGISEINSKNIKNFGWSFEELYQLIVESRDPIKNYQFVVSNFSGKVDDVMSALGSEFIDWIISKHPDKSKFIPSILVETANHQSQRNLVIDPVVSLLSLIFTIQKTLLG
jgi:DNA polymerase III delta prime subunit